MRILAVGVLAAGLTGSLVAGDVAGKVVFQGSAPKAARLKLTGDPFCARAHKSDVLSEEVVVNKNGTLRNVIVYVKDGLGGKKFPVPKEKAKFDQVGCIYVPHVLGVQAGQQVDIHNSDPIMHNVHTLSKANPQFNRAMPNEKIVITTKFDKPETFKVKCDVHSWMGAYIAVFNHPYFAVTGDDGVFALSGLPAGEYTIEAWHEKYPPQTAKVKVDATGKATVDFTFKGS